MNISTVKSEDHVIIIGNGISGITVAKHLRKKSKCSISIISEETPYFFSRTALMYIYMGQMRMQDTQPYENSFWKENNLELLQDTVTQIETSKNQIFTKQNGTLSYDKLILATGSIPQKFGWKGQDLKGVTGMYHKQDLETITAIAQNKESCKRCVIIGGGLIGIELAEMMYSRNIPVTFLAREDSFWSSVLPETESRMISEHIEKHGIDIRYNSNLDKITSDTRGNANGIVIKETQEHIDCNLVGICTGVRPNIDFIKTSDININRGILVNEYLQTNIENVYAIGDCAEKQNPIPNRRNIESVWYTGRIMGETLAKTLTEKPTKYSPSHWFNSAKFFDIEYQTYGIVHNNPNETQKHFSWQHPSKEICVTIAYCPKSLEFQGINSFGIRMRHEVFEKWLDEKQKVDFILKKLHIANFDPEFYKSYENDIYKAFLSETI